MKVLLYATQLNGSDSKLNELVNFLEPRNKVETIQSVNSLALTLRKPRVEPLLTIVVALNADELIDVLSIGELLQDTHLFLVLPDRRPDTIAKGHRLRPRFITYADDDIMESVDVLKKILENVNKESLPINTQQ